MPCGILDFVQYKQFENRTIKKDFKNALNGIRATFHRPHPKKETDRGVLVSVRRFLENAGVKP